MEAEVTQDPAADFDLISLLGNKDINFDIAGVLNNLPSDDVAVICSFTVTDFIGDSVPEELLDTPLYSLEDINLCVEASPFTIAVQQSTPVGTLFLLLPNRPVAGAWWDDPERAKTLERYRKRGERQIEKARLRAINPTAFGSDAWRKRAETAASFIPPGSAIMDIGCGSMFIEEFAAPRHYVPIDMDKRDERTRVVNLNESTIPDEWYSEVDVVVCLGLFEYLNDFEKILRAARRFNKLLICSYNIMEKRNKNKNHRVTLWVNGYYTEEIEEKFRNCGFNIENRIDYSGKQLLWILRPPTADIPHRAIENSRFIVPDLPDTRMESDDHGSRH